MTPGKRARADGGAPPWDRPHELEITEPGNAGVPVNACVADGSPLDASLDATTAPHHVLVGDDVLDLRSPNGRPIAERQGQGGAPPAEKEKAPRGSLERGGDEDGEGEGDDCDDRHDQRRDSVSGGNGDDFGASCPNYAFSEERVFRQRIASLRNSIPSWAWLAHGGFESMTLSVSLRLWSRGHFGPPVFLNRGRTSPLSGIRGRRVIIGGPVVSCNRPPLAPSFT